MSAESSGEVERLLDRIHSCLVTGDIAGLPPWTEALDKAVSVLAGGLPLHEAERLRAKAARNARCIEAAGQGLRAAQRRLAEIRAAAAGLHVYDGQGQRRAILGSGRDLARRF